MKEPLNCYPCDYSASLESVHSTARMMLLKCKWDQIIPIAPSQQRLAHGLDLSLKSMVLTTVWGPTQSGPWLPLQFFVVSFLHPFHAPNTLKFLLLPGHTVNASATGIFHLLLLLSGMFVHTSDICMAQIRPFERSLPWQPYQN